MNPWRRIPKKRMGSRNLVLRKSRRGLMRNERWRYIEMAEETTINGRLKILRPKVPVMIVWMMMKVIPKRIERERNSSEVNCFAFERRKRAPGRYNTNRQRGIKSGRNSRLVNNV